MASAEGIADMGGEAGAVIGKGGAVVGNFMSDFSLYISNMGIVAWVLLFIIVFGSFIVLYLKRKYNLKFTWGPKRPTRRSFN